MLAPLPHGYDARAFTALVIDRCGDADADTLSAFRHDQCARCDCCGDLFVDAAEAADAPHATTFTRIDDAYVCEGCEDDARDEIAVSARLGSDHHQHTTYRAHAGSVVG